ncbi:MAG TPA: VOC family protein [Trichormus sp.]|jgi:catechol 2,3-dioxygenase-like lactoylglutathione lyase family enzyme/quinol monooxygenase YgiN
MFCVIYQWQVKPEREQDFRGTWRTLTEAIFAQHGALGSRLHKSDDGSWIAYAQWPSRDLWENRAETLGVELARSRQSECLIDKVKVLHTLTMTDNLLQPIAPDAQMAASADGISILPQPKLRVARPTDRLEEVVRFYRDGLGLQELGGFENHEGFDGVMLGSPNSMYHLEFTHCKAHTAGGAPSQDHLLVFYLPEREAWLGAVERMRNHGYEPVPSFNPYWDTNGKTFEDPDGYRVVLQNAAWNQ